MLNGHGDDLYLYEGRIKYNFSSNVYHKGCKPALQEFISEHIHTIQNYPSPIGHELNELAAKRYKFSENQFLFTNGATEAFYLIAQLFSNKRAAILAPTFAEYEDACKVYKLEYDVLKRTHSSFADYKLVFICNPNNPDGSIIEKETLELFLQNHPSTTFVIDEAYIEFTLAVQSVLPLVNTYPNLIVVRSLTKSFAIPGLRLGYVVSNTTIISELLSFKMPWSINTLAIEAGKEIFKNYDHWLPNTESLLKETSIFIKQLESIKNVKVVPTHTTYFLVEILKGTATVLKKHLEQEYQILVRDATNFKLLEGEFIRLAVQDKEANNQLIKALRLWG